MRLDTLVDRLAELVIVQAVDGVTKLRRLVLDAAVRGKLVRQDPIDEPASELLKRIITERTRLEATGEIRARADLPPVGPDAVAFPLPVGWAPTQLGEIALCLDYKREPINSEERELRTTGKPRSELYPYYGATQQQGWIDDYIFDGELVLLGEDGVPFLDPLRPKAYVITGKSWVNNHAHVFRGVLVSNRFLAYCLNTFDYQGRVAGSTRAKLNQANALDIPIALPPLAEQKRIVAKVAELMALCDRLEAQQKERETRHAALARASLARFADARTPVNLTFLFHTSYTVPPTELRKTVLRLGVQGKLVLQDPHDSPAAESLNAIAARRAKHVRSHSLRRGGKPIEEPYQIPATWIWTTLDEVADIGTGSTPSRTQSSFWADGTIPWVTSGSTSRSLITAGDDLVTPAAVKAHRLRLYPPGTLLVALYGQGKTRGQVATLGIEATVNQACAAICRCSDIGPMQEYLKLLLEKQYDEMRSLSAGGAQPNLNVQKIKELPVPLPPLAEQRRIVARVDELMSLVDQLETQLAASRTTATKLLDAIVSELTSFSKGAEL